MKSNFYALVEMSIKRLEVLGIVIGIPVLLAFSCAACVFAKLTQYRWVQDFDVCCKGMTGSLF